MAAASPRSELPVALTAEDIDAFTRFVRGELEAGRPPADWETCFNRWQDERLKAAPPGGGKSSMQWLEEEDLIVGGDAPPPESARFPAGKSLKDILEEDGILGAVSNGPRDLSTNPAHMEGFGERRG